MNTKYRAMMDRLEDEARPYGIVRVLGAEHRTYWVTKCGTCGIELQRRFAYGTTPPTQIMVKQLKQKGWDITAGKPAVCPACQKQDKKMKKDTKPSDTLKHESTFLKQETALGTAVILPPPQGVPTAMPNPRLNRQVFALLEDHFDDQARRYRDGWTDERIAKEAGTATVYVTNVRNNAFGELAEDPQVAALRDDVEMARLELTEFNKTFFAKLAELERRVAALTP